MNIAFVIAGGSGTRTGQNVPKQFLTVYDTPIIIYTFLNLQRSPDIDEIIAVIPEGWESFVMSYTKQYNIEKPIHCIYGGTTRHDSISNAVTFAKNNYKDDDILVLVDANRPLIPSDVFQSAIKAVEKDVSVVAVENCYDSMYSSMDGVSIREETNRDLLYKGQAPEAAMVCDWIEVYELANRDGINTHPAAALFLRYGKHANMVKGSAKSFKITTAEDIEIFKALLSSTPGAVPTNTLKK